MLPAPEFYRISTLAQRSGVPAATIKHYMREGLLPSEYVRVARNSAQYDVRLVDRVKTIKELQRTRFLPLRVIKGVLDNTLEGADEETAEAIQRVLKELQPTTARTRAELIAVGVPAHELDMFQALGVIEKTGKGDNARYEGDDLELLRTLRDARKAGLSPEMLPPEILESYARAVRELVRLELRMFREGVVPRAGDRLAPLAEAATRLSERLVVTLRRKMLVPTLRQLVSEELARAKPTKTRASRTRRATKEKLR